MTKGNEEDLGAVAQDSLEGVEGQGVLDETDYTKVKFLGMGMNSLNHDIKIGDVMDFHVRARCIGVGDEAGKNDDQIRHIVKMDVQSTSVIDG